ncbi:MAG TPA: FAD-dependent oxidoreductase [Polyangiales bacterium]|nr:FAD-dependent oxidoreductase [Polyangiales bacterium]
MGVKGRRKVVILGGGVAGMSAAHELIERDFEVEVVERKTIAGGKARSLRATGPSLGLPKSASVATPQADERQLRPPLPGEHGFRFFPGFYKHVVDTMRRIPFRSGSVADNLVNTTEAKIASFERSAYLVPTQFPRTVGDLWLDVSTLITGISGQAGISPLDTAFFASKIWQILSSCEERRLVEYERVNWWDFIEAGSRSRSYQAYYGSGITRSLVAAKARRASSKTIGDIFIQLLLDVIRPGGVADRLLNGPTNDVWIDPWLRYLRARGVAYHTNSEVLAIRCEHGAVRSAIVGTGGAIREVAGDFFIAALPIERLVELLNPALLRLDPSLANLDQLSEYIEWMNGIQFFLREDLPIAHGHVVFIDSPWALTAVSQAQFWEHFDLADYGDGQVKGVLSVDISDWDVKGLNGKAAENCSREEIALETWQQLKKSLNVDAEILTDSMLHSWFLDPGIEDRDADADPSTPRLDTNYEPLLVNYVDTWRLRPEAVTRIPNLFLASDFVRTWTDLATMEAANEAARRAVNGLLRAAGSSAEPCSIWNLHEPELLALSRAHDRTRFRAGLPWGDEAMRALSLVPVLCDDSDSRTPSSPAHEIEGSAAEARASSDAGLRRLRVVRSPR